MNRIWVCLLLLLSLALGGAADAQDRRTAYWASITAGQALMRTGPGRQFPGTWMYVRRDLPVRVVGLHESWRLVEDPDGTRGWMLRALLKDERTGIVRGSAPQPMHESADGGSPVRFRAAPGVVGKLSNCANNWCQLSVGNRRGYIRTDHIWGVDPGESF